MTYANTCFDRDITLAELLSAVPRATLSTALTSHLGATWKIVDAGGMTLLASGNQTGPVTEIPLRIEFETIGRLLAVGLPREREQAVAAWLELVLAGAYRYRMAADLHREAIHADYEALQRQHTALRHSEARYRDLTDQLEQRVKDQVEMMERSHRHLYQAEKMASIGRLASGMAHEINNPIGFIRSNLNTASAYCHKMTEALTAYRRGDLTQADSLWRTSDLEFILEDCSGLFVESIAGADRIARIVANLKAYASIESAVTAPVDLNDSVRAVAAILENQIPSSHSFRLELALQPLPLIAGDQARMNQMIFALVQNARLALPESGGVIRIETQVHQSAIRIVVADNGCGIAPDVLSKIFDPFFTTRDVGKGMGMGLTVSRDIVQAYGGHIDVQSECGEGARFTVSLPVSGKIACTAALGQSA